LEKLWELWGVEISAFPLTWHIALSRDNLLRAYRTCITCLFDSK